MYRLVKKLYDTGFDGYIRPDHGRQIWGESGNRAGYGLYDRALGAMYIAGLIEAIEKEAKKMFKDKVAVITGGEEYYARLLPRNWQD